MKIILFDIDGALFNTKNGSILNITARRGTSRSSPYNELLDA